MYKYKLTVFLKSGHTVVLKCKEWSFTWDNHTGEYTGYKIEGANPRTELVPSQIAGYQVN